MNPKSNRPYRYYTSCLIVEDQSKKENYHLLQCRVHETSPCIFYRFIRDKFIQLRLPTRRLRDFHIVRLRLASELIQNVGLVPSLRCHVTLVDSKQGYGIAAVPLHKLPRCDLYDSCRRYRECRCGSWTRRMRGRRRSKDLFPFERYRSEAVDNPRSSNYNGKAVPSCVSARAIIGKEFLYSIPSHEYAIADIIGVRYEKLAAAQRYGRVARRAC